MERLIGLFGIQSRAFVSTGIALSLLWALLPQTVVALPAEPIGRDGLIFVDSDGDGIADEFDPDDNNDGITDDQEGSGNAPAPDILDPGKDSDGDGISNALDPDDNNNSVTDENDPESFPPPVNSGGNSGGGDGGGGASNPPAQEVTSGAVHQSSESGESGYVIRALPDTGSGAGEQDHVPGTLLVSLASLLAAAGARRHLANRTETLAR